MVGARLIPTVSENVMAKILQGMMDNKYMTTDLIAAVNEILYDSYNVTMQMCVPVAPPSPPVHGQMEPLNLIYNYSSA